jgi:hypothetical protein
MVKEKKREKVENPEEREFENTLDHAVTIRNPTEAYGRSLPPHGGSTFTDIEPGERIMLPMDRGKKLNLTLVGRLPKKE